MSFPRTVILTVGPFVIVSACYWLTMAHPRDSSYDSHFLPADSFDWGSSEVMNGESVSLPVACEHLAVDLASHLTDDCHVIVRSPYVLAGDMTEEDLDRHYQQTIVPTAAVLRNTYFDRTPTRPITILLFSSNQSYRSFAREFDGHRRDAYSGYYQKSEDRLVVNVVTGNGTLAHELTHALAHFDFPEMPEWFDEGLASLHEESELSEDGRCLLGLSNWRRYHLIYALQTGHLRSLDSLISVGEIRDGYEAIDYAHARYFCLFLQSKGLLSPFYRSYRSDFADDPKGVRTLLSLLEMDSLSAVDSEFRSWILTRCRSENIEPPRKHDTEEAAALDIGETWRLSQSEWSRPR